MGIEEFVEAGMDNEMAAETMAYVDTLKQRIQQVRTKDAKIKKFAKEEKAREKLELFMR